MKFVCPNLQVIEFQGIHTILLAVFKAFIEIKINIFDCKLVAIIFSADRNVPHYSARHVRWGSSTIDD